MSKIFGRVYLITNKRDGDKVYVGQTHKPLSRRWDSHCEDALGGSWSCPRFHEAVKLHGVSGFKMQELGKIYKTTSPEEDQRALDQMEIAFIRDYKATDPRYGYNIASGGGGKIPGGRTTHRRSRTSERRHKPRKPRFNKHRHDRKPRRRRT